MKKATVEKVKMLDGIINDCQEMLNNVLYNNNCHKIIFFGKKIGAGQEDIIIKLSPLSTDNNDFAHVRDFLIDIYEKRYVTAEKILQEI